MSDVFKYSGVRKSHQSLNEVYFWTSVIKDWKHLLKEDESDSHRMKKIRMESFEWLIKHALLYFLWEQLKMKKRHQKRALKNSQVVYF